MSLKVLSLRENDLRTLPSEIGALVSLVSLSLSQNKLETLPPEIGRLRALRELTINRNNLVTLPPEFAQLSALQILEMQHNSLTNIPPGVVDGLVNLNVLNLRDNNELDEVLKQVHNIGGLARIPSYYPGDRKLERVYVRPGLEPRQMCIEDF